METAYMIGILCSFAAMTGYGISNCIQRPLAEEVDFRPKLVMYMGAIGTICVAILLLLSDISVQFTSEVLTKILWSSLSGFTAFYFFIKSISYGKVGVTVPIATAYAMVTPLVLLMFFQEMISVQKYMAIATVALGIILIGIDPKQWNSESFHKSKMAFIYAILALLVWGVHIPLAQEAALASHPFYSALGIELANTFCAALILLIGRKSFKLRFKTKSNYTILVVSTVVMVAALVSSNIAFANISASTVAAIMSGSSIVSVAIAMFWLKEKISKRQGVGIAFVVAGLIAVSLLSKGVIA